jgi:hypothetical protein
LMIYDVMQELRGEASVDKKISLDELLYD